MRGELEITQITELSLTTHFAETQLVHEWLEDGIFETIESISAFGKGREGVMAKTLHKMGFYSIFNESFIGLRWGLAGWCGTMTNDAVSIFKPIESVRGW